MWGDLKEAIISLATLRKVAEDVGKLDEKVDKLENKLTRMDEKLDSHEQADDRQRKQIKELYGKAEQTATDVSYIKGRLDEIYRNGHGK